MNNSLENFNKYIDPAKDFFAKYVHLIYFLIVALMIGFLMLRITSLINKEPSADQIQTVKQININSKQADKIRGLQNLNIIVDPSITSGRDNPFQ
jgi:hypothetical protein